ncbi:multinuclear nonheme iron-dependent oxidase [Clostridium sp. Marseille-Q7071]
MLKVPLLIENTPDCLVERRFYKFVPYVFPDQINRLLHDNDVSLLLDITHAKIAARFHGWDIYGYLNALLLNRVKEIHINGCGLNKNGTLIDSHQAMEDEDFALLEWVLCRTNPQVISLEYNGNKNEDESVVASHIQQFLIS